MTGFPLPPGVHDLKAKVTVLEDGTAFIRVTDQADNFLALVDGSANAFRLSVGMARSMLNIQLSE